MQRPDGHFDGEAQEQQEKRDPAQGEDADRKSTRLNSSHSQISYAVFCLKKKKRKSNSDDAGAKAALLTLVSWRAASAVPAHSIIAHSFWTVTARWQLVDDVQFWVSLAR